MGDHQLPDRDGRHHGVHARHHDLNWGLADGRGQGISHCWLAAPLQVKISSWVPGVVLNPSRHLPETGLTSVPAVACHCWLAAPVQVSSLTRAFFSSRETFRHLPLICRVPVPVTVQSWPGLPSQAATTIGVLLAAESSLSATHLSAWYPDTIGPVAAKVA